MHRRIKIVCGLSVFVVLAAAVLHEKSDMPSPTTASRAAIPAATGSDDGAKQLEERSIVTAGERLAVLPSYPLPETVGRFSRSAITTIADDYRKMLAVQGLFNQFSVREQLVHDVLASKDGAAIAVETLCDPGFARAVFGDMQAEARYFSVSVVSRAARDGNEAPLIDAVQGVAARMSMEGSAPSEGRLADLYDLVHEYVKLKGPSYWESASPDVVERLGYHRDSNAAVKETYEEALYLSLYRDLGRANAASLVDRLIGS